MPLDPRESDLPDIGIVTFEDPETGAQITVDTGDARLRERFGSAAAEQAATIDRALSACGAEVMVLGTDDSLLSSVAGFLDTRRRHTTRGGAANLSAFGALWILQFVILDRILFGRSAGRSAGRSTRRSAPSVQPPAHSDAEAA